MIERKNFAVTFKKKKKKKKKKRLYFESENVNFAKKI
jgi:hypothetical protein